MRFRRSWRAFSRELWRLFSCVSGVSNVMLCWYLGFRTWDLLTNARNRHCPLHIVLDLDCLRTSFYANQLPDVLKSSLFAYENLLYKGLDTNSAAITAASLVSISFTCNFVAVATQRATRTLSLRCSDSLSIARRVAAYLAHVWRGAII